ncbi:MAG: MBL fold metallo-hydrolase [Nitrospirae bacterium]|nr:MBL fold metallo-hydrolase [Nitrospirota bacterium]
MSNLRVICWNVEHGNAAYIQTPTLKHIALDLGSEPDFSPLTFLKTDFHIDHLDEVIISHPHTDHLTDILNFDGLSPKVLSRPKHLTESEIRAANRREDASIIDKYIEINNRFNSPLASESNPELPQNNGGVVFHTFKDTATSTANINNHGLVIVLEYLNCKIIFPGDIESPTWAALLQRRDFVTAISDADILIASHHGREAGFYGDLFKVFKPKLTIISDGRFRDTSATARYSAVSDGWTVHRRDKSLNSEERKCITTRQDGHIDIEIWKNDKGQTVLSVTAD